MGILTRIDPQQSLQYTFNRTTYPIPSSRCGYTGQNKTSGVSKHYFTSFRVEGLPKPFYVSFCKGEAGREHRILFYKAINFVILNFEFENSSEQKLYLL